jgi:hypothetical protein
VPLSAPAAPIRAIVAVRLQLKFVRDHIAQYRSTAGARHRWCTNSASTGAPLDG